MNMHVSLASTMQIAMDNSEKKRMGNPNGKERQTGVDRARHPFLFCSTWQSKKRTMDWGSQTLGIFSPPPITPYRSSLFAGGGTIRRKRDPQSGRTPSPLIHMFPPLFDTVPFEYYVQDRQGRPGQEKGPYVVL